MIVMPAAGSSSRRLQWRGNRWERSQIEIDQDESLWLRLWLLPWHWTDLDKLKDLSGLHALLTALPVQ